MGHVQMARPMGLGRRSPITPGRRPSTERIWNKTNLGTVGSKVPPFVKPVLSGDDQAKLDNLSTAYDYFSMFQPDNLLDFFLF